MLFYSIINLIFKIINILILLRILISWLAPYSRNEFVDLIYLLTEPLLRPIRDIIPFRRLNIDLSPLILYFILAIVKRLVFYIIL